MDLYLFILISIILNSFIYYNFDYIAKKINIYDKPDQDRKFHKTAVANIGGIVIFLNIIYLYLLFILDQSNLNDNLYFQNNSQFFSFFFCLIPLILIGILDDKFHLSANVKTFLISIIILFALYFDKELQITKLNFSFLDQDILLNNFSILFTLISIFLFMNALNMMDGINLLTGLYCLFILIILAIFSKFGTLIIFILLGLINYLLLNYRNRVFLGDSGSIILSYMISYFFIKSYNQEMNFYADQIFLMMMVPGIDLLRVASLRLLSGKNPLAADRIHLHHLLANSFGVEKTVIIILVLITLPTLFSIFLNFTLPLIILVLIAYLILIFYISRKSSLN